MSIIALTIGDAAPLTLVLEDGDTGYFPQVNIYQPSNATPISTINLPHTAEGMYEGSYTPSGVGILKAVYTIYEDASHTIPASKYSKELDQIVTSQPENNVSIISEILEKVTRILGMVQENVFIDNTVFDECSQLTGSRIRIFDSASTAGAATDGGTETNGLIATYQVMVEYEAPGKMKTYRVVRL
jgi:hypothetical protein